MYFSIENLKHLALILSGPADFPHSNFDTISVILLAETAMFESCWTFCNFLGISAVRFGSQSLAYKIL